MPNTLIVGYGNPLRGDDGLGWRVAERLHGADAQVLTLQQLTPELMEPISRADRVIFIDAATGDTPGEIRQRTVEPMAAGSAAFSHFSTPEALLAGARSLYGRAAQGILITVTGADFSLSSDLSSAVSQSLDQVVARVLGLLA